MQSDLTTVGVSVCTAGTALARCVEMDLSTVRAEDASAEHVDAGQGRLATGGHEFADELSRLTRAHYGALERIASRILRGGVVAERRELVHDAYIRLACSSVRALIDDSHFIRLMARSMRRVAMDGWRRRHSLKRSGADPRGEHVDVSDVADASARSSLLPLASALRRLAVLDELAARVVALRGLEGCSFEDIAGRCSVSLRSVYSSWKRARVWLREEMCCHVATVVVDLDRACSNDGRRAQL